MFKKGIATLIGCLSAFGVIGSVTVGAEEVNTRKQYQCISELGCWVREQPSIDSEKITLIQPLEVITVDTIVDGWGQFEYLYPDGQKVIGWTYLDNYDRLLVDSDYSVFNTPDCYNNSQKKIFDFLVGEIGFSSAVAHGIVTNIGYESSCNPNAWCIDSNGLESYGICQWNGERCDKLRSFCNGRGIDSSSIDGQLEFLKEELNGSKSWVRDTLLNYGNSRQDCYDAAYYWASKFEVCSSQYWEDRAVTAMNSFVMN